MLKGMFGLRAKAQHAKSVAHEEEVEEKGKEKNRKIRKESKAALKTQKKTDKFLKKQIKSNEKPSVASRFIRYARLDLNHMYNR